MTRLTPMEARGILHACGAPLDTNFFALDSATVCKLVDAGKARGYRRSKFAPGSYGRMFHGYLMRTAHRTEYMTEFEVQGHYSHGWEMVTTEETRRDAVATLRVYRDNEPSTAFRMVRKRVPV